MNIAQITTEHYTFTGAGETDPAARVALADGFARHLQHRYDDCPDEHHARLQWLDWYDAKTGQLTEGDEQTPEQARGAFAQALDDWYGFAVFSIEAGACIRDGEDAI